MNAYTLTAQGIAAAMTGQSRVEQTVFVSRSIFSGSPFGPRHIVLVIPAGEKMGTYYECSDRELALLRGGMSPQDLELEHGDPNDEPPEYPEDDRECSAADRLYQATKEGV